MLPVPLFDEKEGYMCTARNTPGISKGKGSTQSHISLACWIIVRYPMGILIGGGGGKSKNPTVGVLSV